MPLHITAPAHALHGTIQLPTSKSESNRALIIQALARWQGNYDIEIQHLAQARDTQLLQALLASPAEVYDAQDAGTTFRFLTAYLALTATQSIILTGTPRMQQRPVKILVEALQHLGFGVEYLGKEGYPPLRIAPVADRSLLGNEVQVSGEVSSQYISALLMIAPLMPEGLHLTLTGKIGSRPYIEMTLAQMQYFGIQYTWQGDTIHVAPQIYAARRFEVEGDWSAASYWYSMISLRRGSEIMIEGLRAASLQGDAIVAHLMEDWGVRTQFNAQGALLSCKTMPYTTEPRQIDFTHCPDLAQTFIVLAAAKRIPFCASGLESLRIKETDRIAALQAELQKIGAELYEQSPNYWALRYGAWADAESRPEAEAPITIATYEDHRMAMAFAPLALQYPLLIDHPAVVHKSYPSFWVDMQSLGFGVREEEG